LAQAEVLAQLSQVRSAPNQLFPASFPSPMAALPAACMQKLSERTTKAQILDSPSPIRNRQVSEASGLREQAEEVKTPCSLCSLDSSASMNFRRAGDEGTSGFQELAEEVKTPNSVCSLDSAASMCFRRQIASGSHEQHEEPKIPDSLRSLDSSASMHFQRESAVVVDEQLEELKTTSCELSAGYNMCVIF